jgi:hypothetical protein
MLCVNPPLRCSKFLADAGFQYRKASVFDIYVSVHRNVIPSYNQQDATFLDLSIPKDTLHVSGGSYAHHQEHTSVQTASGIVN